MRLLVAILSLVLMSFAAFASESPTYTQDAITARDQIKNSTGRIISIMRGPGFLLVGNTCSATLINDQETIITAGHCFETKQILTIKQKFKKAYLKLMTVEKQYFDIDGVTSRHLSTNIRKLINDSGFIEGRNIRTALGFLKNLPEIKKQKIHEGYKQNPAIDYDSLIVRSKKDIDFYTNLQMNRSSDSVLYDLAIGKLSKKIDTKPAQVAQYNFGEDLFIAGYAGGTLESYLETYKCMTGDTAYESVTYSFDKILSELDIIINNLKKIFATEAEGIEYAYSQKKKSIQTIVNLSEKVRDGGVVSECPGGQIIKGFSGGPQFIVKNGQPMIVGISSTAPQTSVKFGELMFAPKAIHINEILSVGKTK